MHDKPVPSFLEEAPYVKWFPRPQLHFPSSGLWVSSAYHPSSSGRALWALNMRNQLSSLDRCKGSANLTCAILAELEVLAAQSCLTQIAHQGPLAMGFSRQEYWSGLPSPSPGDFPNPGIEPASPALQADSLPSEPSGKARTQKPPETWWYSL